MDAPQITKKFQISRDLKFKYITIVLLNEIINFQTYFESYLIGDDMFLHDYLQYMQANELLEIKMDQKLDKEIFAPTVKGREALVNFYAKYFEYLKVYDIFCAVDLGIGEFAFDSMLNDMSDDEWHDFLNQQRFSDVRVAVAEFKKLDPTEIVFMSFLNEQKFDTQKEYWQQNLTKDGVWNEIEDICNTAISLEYLSKDGVIEDVVKKGSDLMLDLLKRADQVQEEDANQQQEEEEEIITTTTYVDIVDPPYYTYDYFYPYNDIYYVSPVWALLWF